MSESLREKAKHHPQVVNRLLATGLIVSLLFTLGITLFFQNQQYTTNQTATHVAGMQTTLDYENAVLRSQRLITYARKLAEDGDVNRALAVALEAINMENPPLEAHRLLADLMNMPSIEKLIPLSDSDTPFSISQYLGLQDDVLLYVLEYTSVIHGLNIKTGESVQIAQLPDNMRWFDGRKWLFSDNCTVVDRITWQIVRTLESCLFDERYPFAVSPDGKWLVTAFDNRMVVHDVTTGKQTQLAEYTSLGASDIVISPDGHYAYASFWDFSLETDAPSPETSSEALVRFDLTEQEPPLVMGDKAGLLAISPDGKWLYNPGVNAEYLSLRVWSALISEEYASFSDYAPRQYVSDIPYIRSNVGIHDFKLSPDGDTVVMTERTREPHGRVNSYIFTNLNFAVLTIEKWGGKNLWGALTTSLKDLGGGQAFIMPDSRRAVLTDFPYMRPEPGWAPPTVAVVTLKPDKVEPQQFISGDYELIDFDADSLLVVDRSQNTLVRLAAPDWHEIWHYPLDATTEDRRWFVSPNHQFIAVSFKLSQDYGVRLLDVATGRVVQEWLFSWQVADLSIRPDGRQIAIHNWTGDTDILHLFNTATGKSDGDIIPGEVDETYRNYDWMTYSPDGQYLLVTTASSALIYTLNGEVHQKFSFTAAEEMSYSFFRAVFSSDGERVTFINPEGVRYTYNVATGEQINATSTGIMAWGRIDDAPEQDLSIASDEDEIIVLQLSSGYELQRWRLPIPYTAYDPVVRLAGQTVAVNLTEGIALYHIETTEELAARARETRYIPPIDCEAGFEYRDLLSACQTSTTGN